MKMTKTTIAIGGIIALAALSSGPLNAQLINFDFQRETNWADPVIPVHSGAAATGSVGDVWNSGEPEFVQSFPDLLDSAGNTTSAVLTTASFGSYKSTNADFSSDTPDLNPLMRDYAFVNPTGTATISGLTPNADYTLYLYGVSDAAWQDATFSVTGANEGAQLAASTDLAGPLTVGEDYVVFTGNTGGSGTINITVDGGGTFAGWNGFQLEVGGVNTNPPAAPDLASPADTAIDVSVFSDLEWTVGTGATSYGVYLWKSADPAPDTSPGGDAPTATVMTLSYDPGGLEASTAYSWAVKAVNDFGEAVSSTWTFTTDTGFPTAPVLNSPADAATDLSVLTVLEWSAADWADDYAVYLWQTGDPVPDLVNGAPTAVVTDLSYDPGGLDALTEYNWAVTARNTYGNTPSATRTFTTNSGFPGTPSLGGPADMGTDVSVLTNLEWSAATEADEYGVYLWETSGTALTPADPPTATVTDLVYAPDELNPFTSYTWFVKSINSFGEVVSATWTFTTGATPVAPFEILLNVDFQKGSSPVHSGAAATGLPRDFWNSTDTETNTFADLENLTDSAGTATNVDVTWSDELQSSQNPGAIEFGSTGHNALMEDYAFTAGGTTATVTISELPANYDYTLYLYGVPDGQSQDTLFTVTGSNEGAQHVVMGNVNDDNGLATPDDYVVFTGNTGTAGEIVWTQTTFSGQQGGFSGCNGFQLGLDAGGGVEITSITKVGTDLFNVTIEGGASTAYEFRSSPILDFNPGNLVTGLADGIVPTGTVSGSLLTTDANGDGSAQLALTGPVNFVVAQIPPPLLDESFDAEPAAIPAGWAFADNGNGTAWGVANPGDGTSGPSAAVSELYCAGTNMAGNYTADASCTLTTPVVGIPAGGATLSLSVFIDTDAGVVDAGAIRLLDADNSDNEITDGIFPVTGIQGVGSAWNAESYTLPAAAAGKNIKIQFEFTSDAFEQWSGFYIDDVKVDAN